MIRLQAFFPIPTEAPSQQGMSKSPHLAAVLAVTLLVALGQPARAESFAYQLGRGLPLGETGIRLGGYANAVIAAPRSGPWNFDIRDLSLFTTWERGNWRFFSETEVANPLSASEHQDLTTGNARFELERLYIDHIFTDALSVRFGKFLTPIGRWNLIHAAPLVWTTTRPIASYQLFSRNATGLMLHGGLPVGERRLEYAAYTTLSDSLDPYKSENPFENAFGAHLLYSLAENLEVGISYANYELHEEPVGRFNLAGLEATWSYRQFEVSTEWVHRSGGGNELTQGFVQALAPLPSHFYAIGRYEYFQQISEAAGQVGVFGLAFRPIPPLVWKVEYRLGTHNESAAPDGLYGSIAVLF